MLLALPLLALVPLRSDLAGDAFAAARAIAVPEIAEARRRVPRARFLLTVSGGAVRRLQRGRLATDASVVVARLHQRLFDSSRRPLRRLAQGTGLLVGGRDADLAIKSAGKV